MHAAFAVWCNLLTSEARHKQTWKTHLSNSNELGCFSDFEGICPPFFVTFSVVVYRM